jgi:hypothetical protein
MNIETRRQANRLGHAAEWRAVWRLRLAGYSILARRYKTKLGEIDIVARRGGVLAFVEVKARGRSRDRGLLALRPPVRPGRRGGQPVRGAPSALCRAFAALRRHAGGRAVAAPSAGRLARAGVVRAARAANATRSSRGCATLRGEGARIDLLEAALTSASCSATRRSTSRRCISTSRRSRATLPTWCAGAARSPSGWPT